MYDVQKKLDHIDEVIAQGPYSEDWDSLSQHQTPKWFRDAKFGIFIHWGLFTVPSFNNEWYPRNMYIQGTEEFEHHVKTYGPQSKFGYKDFIPMFKAEKFDADYWAELFKETGAKFAVPVAEHHDGFQMYRSEISPWNAYEMGPHRDIIGELTESFKRHGIINCASSHRMEHWFFLGHGRDFDSDVRREADDRNSMYWPSHNIEDDRIQYLDGTPQPDEEYLKDWLLRTVEIIDRYHPHELYFDWWIMNRNARPYTKKLAAYFYNQAAACGEDVLLISKNDSFPYGAAVPDMERGSFGSAMPFPWQTDTAIAKNSWCYTEQNVYKKPWSILCDFVDAISKNGTMLLNVGPKPDGTFSDEDLAIMKDIGSWMKKNAEAVYGSRPWRIQEEGSTHHEGGAFSDGEDSVYTSEDIRFVINHGRLYAFVMRWPENGDVLIKSLPKLPLVTQLDFNEVIDDVSVLGYDRKVSWKQNEKGLLLHADGIETDEPAAVRISLK